MAYNSKAAQDNDEGLRRMDLQRAYAESQASRGAPAGTPPAPPTSADADAAPAPARPAFQVPAAEPSPATRGYAARVAAPHAPSLPGLTWRLERLIDEVSAFRNFSPERIAIIKAEAAKRPAEATAAYDAVFKKDVVPFKERAAQSMPEAMRQHPDETVFAVRRGQDIRSEHHARGTGLDLLHGALMEVVPMRATPFRAPSEVFAAPRPEEPTVALDAVEVAVDEPQAPAPSAHEASPAETASLDLVADEDDNPFAALTLNEPVVASPTAPAPVTNAPAASLPEEPSAPAPEAPRFSRFRRT